MFDGLDKAKTAFVSPHRYQLILEATFSSQGKDVTDVYFKDRQANPATRIYTLNPDPFVLTRAFSPQEKPRRGRVERRRVPGPPRARREAPPRTPKDVSEPHASRPWPDVRSAGKKPAELEYILFGKRTELFLAHAIFAPPDFDQ